MSDAVPDGVYGGSYERVPFDLDAEIAGLGGDETCHVCDLGATWLVRLSQDPNGDNEVELGEAVLLCGTCYGFADVGDAESLASRFEDPRGGPEELLEVARRITEGAVEAAQVLR